MNEYKYIWKFSVIFRLNMSVESTVVKSHSAKTEEKIIANNAKIQTLLDASFLHGEHDAFKEHLENNPVRQDFNGTLKQGIELVVSRTRTMSDVAPTLKVLLQNGAKWTSGYQLPGMTTPYHVICRSTGDHWELLKLMITNIGQTLVNAKDDERCTALMRAVQNANIKCVECLIANGADVNHINDTQTVRSQRKPNITYMYTDSVSPLIDSINWLHPKSPHSSNIMVDIFDLLLDSGADVNQPCFLHKRTPVMYAADIGNIKCVEKLIQRGARVNPTHVSSTEVWVLAAKSGNVDVLKYLVEDQGIDKDSIDKDGCSVLYWTVTSGNIEAIRYLLDLGVATSTYIPQESVEPCDVCGTNLICTLIPPASIYDPVMRCIELDMPEIIKVMVEHGGQLYNHPAHLIYAVICESLDVVDYLLSKHKHQLNFNFNVTHTSDGGNLHETLLTVACQGRSVNMIKLLLDHGADPNKKNCEEKCPSVLSVAIFEGHVDIIARFIRGGVNMNSRSAYLGMARASDQADIGIVLPFEAAVWDDHIYAAEMLLVSECSRGVYSVDPNQGNQELHNDIEPNIQELLKKWDVRKNNVLPLQQRCRMVILNHLSPQADKKIVKLPLPSQIINYLRIPELDEIVDTLNSNPRTNSYVYSVYPCQ